MIILTAVGIALFVAGFILTGILLSPIYAFRSADAFEKGEKWFIIFTRRRPNRLMQRIKGTDSQGKPVDFIGIIPRGRTYRGETPAGKAAGLTKDNPDYWWLENEDNVLAKENNHRFAIVRLWVWYINLFSDVALVGLRILYDIDRYPIEKIRFHKKTGSEGKEEYTIDPPDTKEVSNHVRIAPFQWAVSIVGAETHDRVSWSLLLVVNVKSRNPWLTLHNHENWSQFLTSALVDSVVRGLRDLTLPDVVGLAKEGLSNEARDKIIRPVYEVERRLLTVIGLEFDRTADLDAADYSGAVQLLAVDPQFLNPADTLAFTQPWRAKQQAEEEVTLGKAEAERESTVIGAVAEKVKAYGEAGMFVQRMQALENAAKTGKSTIIFDTGDSKTSNIEKLLALQIEERLNKKEDE